MLVRKDSIIRSKSTEQQKNWEEERRRRDDGRRLREREVRGMRIDQRRSRSKAPVDSRLQGALGKAASRRSMST